MNEEQANEKFALGQMTIFELLKFEFENKGVDREWENWFNAVEDTYPFDAIFERIRGIENQLYELQAQFARLVNVLDKEAGGIKVSLKEWIKR